MSIHENQQIFLESIFEEMFYIVACTESNYLKLLMIIGNVKQTVTYMEFEKKIHFWEKGMLQHDMGKSITVYFAKCFFCFVLLFFFFFFFSLLSNICQQQSKFEIRRSILLGREQVCLCRSKMHSREKCYSMKM